MLLLSQHEGVTRLITLTLTSATEGPNRSLESQLNEQFGVTLAERKLTEAQDRLVSATLACLIEEYEALPGRLLSLCSCRGDDVAVGRAIDVAERRLSGEPVPTDMNAALLYLGLFVSSYEVVAKTWRRLEQSLDAEIRGLMEEE